MYHHGQKQTHRSLLVRTSPKHLPASPAISSLWTICSDLSTRRRSAHQRSRTRVIRSINSGRVVEANVALSAQLQTPQWGSRLDGLTLSVIYTRGRDRLDATRTQTSVMSVDVENGTSADESDYVGCDGYICCPSELLHDEKNDRAAGFVVSFLP